MTSDARDRVVSIEPGKRSSSDGPIEMPVPTAWPMILAFGISLLAAALVTNAAFAALGLILIAAGIAGWVRESAPGRGHASVALVPPEERAAPVLPVRRRVEHLKPGSYGHRMRVPEKVHPYSAGAIGGLAGGVAMALVAFGYGAFSGRGVWYPINLVAAMAIPGFDEATVSQLEQFSATGLTMAATIHLVSSVLVGLMYGLILPMLPRHPILWGSMVAPLIWTGALHGTLGVLNPGMAKLVHWPWFIASQFAFGLVVGFVVVRSEKVHTSQLWTPSAEEPS